MVRVDDERSAPTILRYLDTGAHGAHIPWVNRRRGGAGRAVGEDSHRHARAGRQPGVRMGAARSLSAYVERANRETLVVIQIETQEVSTPSTTIWRSMVSMCCSSNRTDPRSLGHPGDLRHPDVLAALERVATRFVGSDKILDLRCAADMTH